MEIKKNTISILKDCHRCVEGLSPPLEDLDKIEVQKQLEGI